MEPIFFESQHELRKWFEENHELQTELLVGYHKVGTGRPSITWSQSVDEAICVGWIDGVRKSIDENSYTIRFTPRKPKSIWSAVNIKKVEDLTQKGLMKPAGLRAFEKREDKKSKVYAFEQKNIAPDTAIKKAFKASKKAFAFFNAQPPSYQKTAIWWVLSARQEQTKKKRLLTLIADSEAGLRIKSQRRPGKNQ